MSVIQKIRDKYARVAVIAIAVALIGFILTDYISGRGRNLFSGDGGSDVVGRVNGKKIGANEFSNKVKQTEEYQKNQGYAQTGDAAHQQIVDQVWEQEINKVLLSSEISRLGMQIGKRELNDILFVTNTPDDIKRAGTDPQTNQYNPTLAQQEVNRAKKRWTQVQRDQFNQYLEDLAFQRMTEKYNALLTNTSNTPRWMIEKQNADNSLMAKISFVREMYVSIPDSSVKITDQEINDYVSKHKEDFKQPESRSIAYVRFSASPNAADSADARNRASALKQELDTTENVEMLLNREGSPGFYAGYISGKNIQIPAKDSIFKTPVGEVYGPYRDGGSFSIAKVMGTKQIPDTVKIRHILIATAQRDPQSGQMMPTRDTTEARKIIDSVQTVIRNGSNFDSVCLKVSDDGTKDKGGVYDNVYSGQMVAEFNDFIFTNPVGAKGVVKTEFGYHYIEILSQKGSATGYKIAYISKPVVTSNETDASALNSATDFAGKSKNEKEFNEVFEKELKPKGYNKGIATGIGPNSVDINQVGASKSFIRKVYESKLGDVILADGIIGTDYLVAVITEVKKEGTQDAAAARVSVEPLLRNKKKAEMLKQKVGKVTTLEAAAVALGGKAIEVADSLRISGISPKMRLESRVTGAAFNANNKGKVIPEALEGQSGIYVIRIDDLVTTPVTNASVADERNMRYQQAKQNASYSNPTITALRADATIVDRRAKLQQQL